MKDLTRREIVLLCAYAVLLAIGLRWVVRSLRPGGNAVPVLTAGLSIASTPFSTAVPEPERSGAWCVRLAIRGRSPSEGLPAEDVRVFASRACPEERLSEWLGTPGVEREEAVLASDSEHAALARFGASEASVRHVSVYVNGHLAAVALAGGGDRELAIEIDPALVVPLGSSVRGGFRDSLTLAPLAGRITLERGARCAGECELDAAGAFVLDELAPGPARLVAHFGERGLWRRDLELGSGSRIELGWIDLPRACAVRGRLFRPDEGIAAFPVLLEPVAAADASALERWTAPGGRDVRLTYSEADGRFQIAPVEPGRYLLRVPPADEGFPSPTPEAYASAVLEIDVREGEFEEYEVCLEPTRKVIPRASFSGAPFSGVTVLSYQLLDVAGHALRAGRIRGGRLPQFELGSGWYSLVLLDQETERAASTFEIAEGQDEIVVELTFEPTQR